MRPSRGNEQYLCDPADISAAAARARKLEPEQKLQLAVLEQAVEDIRRTRPGPYGDRARSDAIAWMLRDDQPGPFSFTAACEAIDATPEAVREALGVRGLVGEATNWDAMPPRVCAWCEREFEPHNGSQVHCRNACRLARDRALRRESRRRIERARAAQRRDAEFA